MQPRFPPQGTPAWYAMFEQQLLVERVDNDRQWRLLRQVLGLCSGLDPIVSIVDPQFVTTTDHCVCNAECYIVSVGNVTKSGETGWSSGDVEANQTEIVCDIIGEVGTSGPGYARVEFSAYASGGNGLGVEVGVSESPFLAVAEYAADPIAECPTEYYFISERTIDHTGTINPTSTGWTWPATITVAECP